MVLLSISNVQPQHISMYFEVYDDARQRTADLCLGREEWVLFRMFFCIQLQPDFLPIWSCADFYVCLSICAGVGHPHKQVAAGFKAGHLCPGLVCRVPLLLRHDRVQRLHLCQLAHVHGGLERSSMQRLPKPQKPTLATWVFFFFSINWTYLATFCFPPLLAVFIFKCLIEI